MARVSIVIPTFRRPELLRRALASAVAQTYADLEVLVCDNADDPEVARLVRETDDPRVVHVARPHNLGMLRNAVEGFRRASGTFVMKLDDDDELLPDCVEVLVGPMEADPSVTLSFGDFAFVDLDGRVLHEQRQELAAVSGTDLLRDGRYAPFEGLVVHGAVQLVAGMLRRDSVDWHDVPDDVATSYDLHLALEAARDGRAAHRTSRVVARCAVHPGQDTRNHLVRQQRGTLFVLDRALAAGRHVARWELESRRDAVVVRLARLLLAQGVRQEARALLTPLPAHDRPAAARLRALSHAPVPVARAALALRQRCVPGRYGTSVSTGIAAVPAMARGAR